VDPIAAVKDLANLVKKYNDIDLNRKITDLSYEVFELAQSNLKLKDQVAKLEASLSLRESLVPRNNFYWLIKGDGEDGPFCMRCYDKDGAPRRMISDHGRAFTCPACYLVLDKDGQHVDSNMRARLQGSVIQPKPR